MTTVGLLVALPGEKKTLTNARIKPGRFSRLNTNTLVCLSGVGPENAAAGAALLMQQGCKLLISWGCAAAIHPDLKPGDLVIPEKLVSASGETLNIDNQWRRLLLQRIGDEQSIHTGAVAESLTLVESAAEKRNVRCSTGAAALDMESAAIARSANKNKVPAIAIRAIADPASMNLPKPVANAIDIKGNVQLYRLLANIVRHPTSIPELIRLGFSFRAAQNRLQNTARGLDWSFSAIADPQR